MTERSTTFLRVYTDEEAVREGLLIPITADGRVNRVSRAVYDAFVTQAGDAEPAASDVTALLDAIRAIAASGSADD